MTGKDQFIKMPRDLLESAALRTLGINAWRVVHFLMIEHLRHGGRENGNLKAPHRQLVQFGIAPKYVAAAICEAEEHGLVECRRHGLRIATVYALTWLPLHDGSAPTDLWREYPGSNLPNKSKAGLPNKSKADGQNLPNKGEAEPREICLTKDRRSIEGLTTGGAVVSVLEEEGTEAERIEGVAGVGLPVAGKPNGAGAP